MKKKIFYSVIGFLIYIAISCSSKKKPEINKAFENLTINDSLITIAVEDEIGHHPEIASHYIDASTKGGIVVLSGNTESLLSKERAAEIASQVKGVNAVVNQIVVVSQTLPDNELKKRIEGGLYNDPVTNSWDIDVQVSNGEVTLKGVVDSWQQVEFAEDVVKSIQGVKNVNNQLIFHIEEKRPDEQILLEIERIYLADALLDHSLIKVDVENGKVTLTGVVGSLPEKSLARANAYVSGVDTVDASALKIEYWARDPKLRTNKYVKKSDEDIQAAVQNAFLYDERVKDFSINVYVKNGYVTLTGITNTLSAKKSAGEDASNVVGVWGVDNRIKVRSKANLPDSALLTRITTALKNNSYLYAYDFDLNIINGKLYIDGEVSTPFERIIAQNVVENVPGIAVVNNSIRVSDFYDKYTARVDNTDVFIEEAEILPDNIIKTKIEYEFWRSPFINENEIDVTVENGLAILTGTVETGIERDLATRNAYEGGALTVENNIEVSFLDMENK